jgi:hypothetical protein
VIDAARARVVWILAAALAWSVVRASPGHAQIIDQRWAPLTPLSSRTGRTAAATMVSDPFGYVHAFWIASDDGGSGGGVRYSRFDGTTWSDAIPIAGMPHADSNHRSVGAAIDHDGVLHVVWNSGITGPTHYARAPVQDSIFESSWSRPREIGFPAYRVDLQVDAKGVLHLLFTRFYDDQRGVYYARSADGGETWTAATHLDPDMPAGYAPYYTWLRQDAVGGLHAVWQYFVPETARGKTIHYARSLDGGDTWSRPLTLGELDASAENLWLAHPSLVVSGEHVHVVWAGGAANSTYRVHRFSSDRGEHWSEPKRIFGELHGQADGDGMAIDGVGHVHWTGQVRYPQAVYHAVWDGNRWSAPAALYLIARVPEEPVGDRVHAHNIRTAVREGNQLVVTFTGMDLPKVLYATQRTLDDVPASRIPLPDMPRRRLSHEMWVLIAVVLLATTSAIRRWSRGRPRRPAPGERTTPLPGPRAA